MKYPRWESYTQEQKQEIINKEIQWETYNATTKEDLVNMLRFEHGYAKFLQNEIRSVLYAIEEIKESLEEQYENGELPNVSVVEGILMCYGIGEFQSEMNSVYNIKAE